MSEAIRVSADLIQRLVNEARQSPDNECCGLLAGSEDVITDLLPAHNALASATAYEISPEELFQLFRNIRERGLNHLGIYHSHPVTENAPSPSDIIRAYYPQAVYLIVSPRNDVAKPVRAFEIRDGAAHELTITEE